MEKTIFKLSLLVVTASAYKFLSPNFDADSSLSILYTHDKSSDRVTEECLTEMYPRNLYRYPLHIERNDIPCIIHCVLKKFNIMSNDGRINIRNYYRRVAAIHRYDPRILISDVGETCAQNINGMNLDHDVCKKAKVFNDSPLLLVLLAASAYARISVMYAHDKMSDIVAEACLNEMFPKSKRLEFQESDEPCILFCVLKKFGIMNANGNFNLEVYRKRVQVAHQLERGNIVRDYGSRCVDNAEATQYKQDVCKKAKVFNDCTHLYRLLMKK